MGETPPKVTKMATHTTNGEMIVGRYQIRYTAPDNSVFYDGMGLYEYQTDALNQAEAYNRSAYNRKYGYVCDVVRTDKYQRLINEGTLRAVA